MVLRFLKANLSVNYLFLLISGPILWLGSLLHPTEYPFYSGENELPLTQVVLIVLKSPFSQVILSLVLLFICALLIERINNKFAFIRISTPLAALLFILLTSGLTGLHVFHPVYFASLFFLLMIYRLFNSFDLRKPYSPAFDSGFLLGVGSLFYLNLTILLPAILISMGILCRESRWREPLIQVTGFLLPWIFAFTFYFLVSDPGILVEILKKNMLIQNVQIKNDIPLLVYFGFLSFIILIGSFFIIRHYDEGKISSRKFFVVFFIFFVFLLASVFTIPSASQEIVVLIAVPVTYLVTNYLVSIRNIFWGELIFSLLVMIIIAMQFIQRYDLGFLSFLVASRL